MISVEEAVTIIQNTVVPLGTIEHKVVSEALGHVLFEDVISPIDMPPFRQSAMDGYALCLSEEPTYQIIGEVKAGDDFHPILKIGEAVRIFTGAPVPDSANAVMMQEKVSRENEQLRLTATVSLNDNIRPLGEQVTKHQIALKKGTLLTPAAIAFITSLGITEVAVHPKPSIAIVVTGNELVEAGQKLAYGQIYESNALMLSVTLEKLGYGNLSKYKVNDDYNSTVKVLEQVINDHDIVLVSGGISVGDYDFVGKALQELGVVQSFYKVRQKPGKPLFFGSKENKIIFALPGNPASALSCFYVYVHLALERLSGNTSFSPTQIKAKTKTGYLTPGNRGQFLKAIYHQGTVDILDGQSSAMLHTFALANALVYIPETIDEIKAEDIVDVLLLPIN
jgi:molybdopterin molybdotransferase